MEIEEEGRREMEGCDVGGEELCGRGNHAIT
jgi:hypothetical protein